jgi:hypothetical protein
MHHRLLLIILATAITVGELAIYSKHFPADQSAGLPVKVS